MRNFLLCLVLAVLISLAGCMQQQDKVDQTGTDLTSVPVSHDETYLSCLYYDESVFLYNLDCSKSYDLSRPPVIALSPHYNQAMFLTTSILQEAKDLGAAYQTVVILAPNHSGLGAPVQCANQSWQTPFGTCATDAAWVKKIVLDPEMKAAIDNERLVEDHSASTPVSYTHLDVYKRQPVHR